MVNYLGFHVKLDDISDNPRSKRLLYHSPCQIMIKPNFNSYIEPLESKYVRIIHVYYTYLIFSHIFFTYRNYILPGLLKYIEIKDELKFTYVLAHLPSNIEQFELFTNGLNKINKLQINKCLLLEDTHFYDFDELKSKHHLSPVNFYYYLLEQIHKYNLNLCLDTAHMFSNTLTIEEMINVLQKAYDMKILKVIHLNGNSRNQDYSDKHIEFFSESNKIKAFDRILKKINTFDDITLIVELDNYDIEEYKRQLKNYDNIVIPG